MAFGWTRTLWDAAKEVHWYYVNNNQPHLNGLRNADLAGPNPKFIDFVRKIEDEANGPPRGRYGVSQDGVGEAMCRW